MRLVFQRHRVIAKQHVFAGVKSNEDGINNGLLQSLRCKPARSGAHRMRYLIGQAVAHGTDSLFSTDPRKIETVSRTH